MIERLKSRLILCLDSLAQRPHWAVAIILLLSCTVRLSVLALYLLNGSQLYTGEADNIARSLVMNGTYANPFAIPTGPTAHCAPVYPFIGAVIYGVFGVGAFGEMARCITSILVFSLLYSLLPQIAVRFGFDFRAGLLAGIVIALLPIKRSAEILGGWETPYAAISLAFLLAWTLDLWQQSRFELRTAFLWGMAWGAVSLLQTAFFAVFVALCGVFLFVRCRLRTGALVAVSILGCCLVLLPWTIRNREALGAWIFVRSNLGIELEVGNHEGARPDIEENVSSRLHPLSNPARARDVRDLGEVEYNRRALRRAVSWIRQNPLEFLRLTGEKCFRFWFSTPIHPIEFAITFPIMIAALWGMVRYWKRAPDAFVLWAATLVAFSLIYYVTQYSARYRAVVEWMWLIAAGQLCLDWMMPKSSNVAAARNRSSHDGSRLTSPGL